MSTIPSAYQRSTMTADIDSTGSGVVIRVRTAPNLIGSAISVDRHTLLNLLRTELNLIVIEKAELPEVEAREWLSAGDAALDSQEALEGPGTARDRALGYLALAAHLEANPPIDPKVEALAARLWGINITPDATQLAKTLITHGIDIKDQP